MIRALAVVLAALALGAAPQGSRQSPRQDLADAAPAPAVRRELWGLVAAERRFARAARERGIRAAFLENLAEDSIIFRPGPVDGRRWFEERERVPGTLLWEPHFAEVSDGGDLGYTAGPWEYRSDGDDDPAFGHYVSVWRRRTDGGWEVVVDGGVTHVGRTGPVRLTLSRRARLPAAALPEPERARVRDSLLQTERRLHRGEGPLDAALAETGEETLRLYRDGSAPMIGLEAALSFARGRTAPRGETSGAGLSAAGDLGYTYGVHRASAESPPTSAYVRVWRRAPDGRWRLALDATTRLPPPGPSSG